MAELVWVPLCPECGAWCRRDLDEDPMDWHCDLHGMVVPRWEEREWEEE